MSAEPLRSDGETHTVLPCTRRQLSETVGANLNFFTAFGIKLKIFYHLRLKVSMLYSTTSNLSTNSDKNILISVPSLLFPFIKIFLP